MELLASTLSREHGRELSRLEREELARLLPIYQDAREKILGKLAQVQADTFTRQHYRVARVQIERGIREMVAILQGQHERGLDAVLEAAIEQTLEEIAFWDAKFRGGATGRIQLAAVRRLATPRSVLLHRFKASTTAYGENLIVDIQGRLARALVQRSSWRDMSIEVAGRLQQHAIAGSRWRAERIVRTELVNALNAGHQAALEASAATIPGLKRQWDSTLDTRTSDVCLHLNGQVVAIDKPWVYEGRPIHHPPGVPNCRSRVIPWHRDWLESEPERS